jgi:hypothetical protein
LLSAEGGNFFAKLADIPERCAPVVREDGLLLADALGGGLYAISTSGAEIGVEM